MRTLGFVVVGSLWVLGCGSGGPPTTNPDGSAPDGSMLDGSIAWLPTAGCAGAPGDPLSVSAISPASGATDVGVATQVLIAFNHSLNFGSVAQAVVLEENGTTNVPITATYIPSSCTLVLTPDDWLRPNRTYTVTLADPLVGAGGQRLAAPYSSTFQTGPGYTLSGTPPRVAAEPPGGLYASTQMVVLACDELDLCDEIRYTTDGTEPGPTSTLYEGAITIDDDTVLAFFATDLFGLDSPTVIESYVIDRDPPAVVGHSPADGAIGVLHDEVVEIEFDEPMDPATLNPGTIRIEPGVAGDIAYDVATHRVVVTPYERLDCGEVFTVTVTTGATDLAGNGLASEASFTFTSHVDCSPPRTTASVLGGPFRSARSVALDCDDGAGAGCARIHYTLDESVPSPTNGITVNGATVASIAIPVGETTLLYYAEDLAGNREVMRRQHYSVSTSGFVFHGASGIHRGVGKRPTETIQILPDAGGQGPFAYDAVSGRFYHVTNGRLFASDDDGVHWFSLATGVYSYVEPHNEVIYTAGSAGLMVSTDGGGTFSLRADAPSRVTRQGRDVYGATYPLMVSHDKGYTWETRDAADGLASSSVQRVVVEGTRVYVATSSAGLGVSDNGGTTFMMRTTANGLPTNALRDLDVDGATVYVATETGLAISQNNGTSFPVVRTTANGLGDNYVNVVRAYGSRVLAGTGAPFLSSTPNSFAISLDAGSTFDTPALTANGDVRAQAVHLHAGSIYVSAYPSYYVSDDDGATFRLGAAPTSAVENLRCYGGSVYASIGDSSGQPGLAISADLGETWRYVGRETGLLSAAINDVYVGSEGLFVATNNGLGISQNDGQNFAVVGTAQGIGQLLVDTVDVQGGQIYVGSFGIQVSTNLTGASFSTLYPAVNPWRLRVDGSHIYMTDGGSSVHVSNNAGANFSLVALPAGTARDALDVGADGTVYVGVGNYGMYRSTNHGASWMTTNVPMTSVDYVVAQGSDVFAGVYEGVSTSTDGGASFTTLDYGEGGVSAGGCFVP